MIKMQFIIHLLLSIRNFTQKFWVLSQNSIRYLRITDSEFFFSLSCGDVVND